jgi:Ser/Thr protein kinase RdoA (MazF antagonist)
VSEGREGVPVNAILEPPELLPWLGREYELAGPIQCELIRRGFNDHYAVTAGDARYVLRIYLNRKYYIRSEADFLFELELLEFLRVGGVPVSHALRRRDGAFLGAIDTLGGQRCLALFSFAEGEVASVLNVSQASRLGETVAALHRRANDFRSPHRRYHLDLEYLVERPMRLMDAVLRDQGRGDIDAYRRFADRLAQRVRELPTTGDSYGIIHGDLHRRNCHWADGDRVTLFDFDHGGYGWRAYDLAVCSAGLSDEARAAFLDGYRRLRQPSDAELAIIPTFQQIRPIWDYGDILAMATAWGEEEPPAESCDRIIRMFERLMQAGSE